MPAWIMKYYILDLSAGEFAGQISHRPGLHRVHDLLEEPGSRGSRPQFDDYRTLGVMSALDALAAIVPDRKVHAAGYCIGGTLLAITAAAMARDGDDAPRHDDASSRRRPTSRKRAS